MDRDEFLTEVYKRAKTEKARMKKRNKTAVLAITAAVLLIPVSAAAVNIYSSRNAESSQDIITELQEETAAYSEEATQSNRSETPTGGEPLPEKLNVNGRALELISRRHYSVFTSDMPIEYLTASENSEALQPVIVRTKEEFYAFSSLTAGLQYIKDDEFFDDYALFAVILPGYSTSGAYYEEIFMASDKRELSLEIPQPGRDENNAAVIIIEIEKSFLNSFSSFSAEFYDTDTLKGE